MTRTMNASEMSVWDAIEVIADMMLDDGLTADDIRTAEQTMRGIKSDLYEVERFDATSNRSKMAGDIAWILDKVAMVLDEMSNAEGPTVGNMKDLIESLWVGCGIERIDAAHENDDDEDQHPLEFTQIFDGDFGGLVGYGLEWQYDMEEITDMTTEMDCETYTLMWKRPEEMPTLDDIAACQWTPITENVQHLIEACEQGHRLPYNISEVDAENVIERLSVVDEDGQRVWRDVPLSKVASVIYDEAILTSEHADTWAADDMPDHIDGMWDILWWSDTAGPLFGIDNELGFLRTVLSAITDDDGQWKRLTHAEVHDIILDCIRAAKNL